MVKLQKRFAYNYKGKDYYKHIITIPDEYVQALGWKPDIELEPSLDKDKLILKAKWKTA
jgi:hypothetical protein